MNKKSGNDVVLLALELLLLAFGPALFAGGLFPIILSQSLGATELTTAVTASIAGILGIVIGAGIAAFRYANYN